MQRLAKIASDLAYIDWLDEKIKIDLEIEKLGDDWGVVVPVPFLDRAMSNLNRYKELLGENKEAIKREYEFSYLDGIFKLKRDVKKFGWDIRFRSNGEELVLDFLNGGMFLVNKDAVGRAVLLDRFDVDNDFIITKSEKFRFVRS